MKKLLGLVLISLTLTGCRSCQADIQYTTENSSERYVVEESVINAYPSSNIK